MRCVGKKKRQYYIFLIVCFFDTGSNFLYVFRISEMSPEREQAATPTLEKRDINWNQLNESLMSGYEGDKEDEGESFFENGQF